MVAFTKMHGAGNDFILVDNRDRTFPSHNKDWMAQVSRRKVGVGCDGFVLIEPTESGGHFRMRFFNPDGNEAEMCGNGARCVARYAYDHDIAPASMSFETVAGPVKANVLEDGQVCIELPPPTEWDEDITVPEIMDDVSGQWINTGVPHAVFPVDQVEAFDVTLKGRKLRWHQRFQPSGTNVDFFSIDSEEKIRIRTYERGVEEETLACGTGVIATALCAYRMGLARPPVTLKCKSADELIVDFSTEKLAKLFLTGPAVTVFEGTLPDPPKMTRQPV